MNTAVYENDVEVAARATTVRSPIDVLPANFLSLNYSIYKLFRGIVVAGYNARGVENTSPEVNALLQNELTGDIKKISADFLRSAVSIIPGDGKKNIVVSYSYSLLGIGEAVKENFAVVFGKGRSVDLLKASDAALQTDNVVIRPYVDEPYRNLTEAVKAGYNTLDYYKSILSVNLTMDSAKHEGYEGYVDLTFKVNLSLHPDVYNKFVDSDSFSPYVLQMGITNALSASNNRADIVIDPRKTSSLTKQITSAHGSPKPRVNKNGFAVYSNGLPLLIPKEADFTTDLIRAGDAALNAEGAFDESILIERGFANRIIYVDWLNDILAYTTANAKIEVLSLIGVTALTPDVEYAYMQTPVSDSSIYIYIKTIIQSLSDVSTGEIERYIDNSIRKDVQLTDIVTAANTIANYGGKEDRITLANLCGHNLSSIENPAALSAIHVFRAYTKYLVEARTKDQSVLKIPQNFASQGLRFRLIGLEYILFAISSNTDATIEVLRKEWAGEQLKKRVDKDVNQTFAIPNMKIGGNGLVGLMPHQSRIYSSMRKVPRLAVLPIDTGGGKTLMAILDALAGIQSNPGMRPVISTKGNLVKGMVTEINRMSQGALNAIPLRAAVLRRLKRYGIDTLEKLIKWVKGLPPNTIFINAYSDYSSRSKIYKEVPSITGFGNKSVIDSQYLRIMRIISFEMAIGDESHLIKNPDSNRSRGAYSAFSSTEYKRIMSGTVVSNTVKDIVGQTTALSPAIFGDDPEAFCTKYGIERGIIKDNETASFIKKHMGSFAAYHQAISSEWSFMLPAKEDEIINVALTPKQDEFYTNLMLAAYLELTGKKKPAEDDSEDAAEDDDDEDEEDEDAEADEAFIAQARKVFQTVEQFLSAPDENEQYVSQVDRPTGSDLISPKVAAADKLIDEILRRPVDPDKNKIIVFGINISAVKHFMRHSRHAKDSLVYFAGDYEALRQYSTDPTKRIIIAAETSIREGENLQMTGAIIKLQVPWAPGDYTQSLARMYRPDPRGKYNRDSVNHYVISATKSNGEVSLDNCKMARLISKFVSNGRLTYEGDPRWMRVSKSFDDLGLVTMNLDFIFNTKMADLQDYFGAWGKYVGFENQMNREQRATLARTLEASLGKKLTDENGKILDVQEFIKAAMSDVEAAPIIPGSKSVYTPWIIGSLPPDPDNLGYEILGSQPVHEGDVVLTEFGPGIVRRISPRTVKVETYGGKLTGFRRTMVCVVPDINKPKLQAIVKDGKKWQAATKDPFGKVGSTAIRGGQTPVRDNEPPPPKGTKPKVQKEKKETVDINTAIINGMPALVIMNPAENIDALDSIGWQKVDPYTSVSCRTWNAMTNVLDQIETKSYVPPKVLNALQEEIEEFKHGTTTKFVRQITQAKVRQFFVDQRKKYGKKDKQYVVVPYLIAIDDSVRLAFDRDSHDPKVIRWLHNQVRKLPGVANVKDTEGLYIKVFKDIAEARKHMSQLVGAVNFDEADLSRELNLLRDEIKELMSARKRPMA